MPEHYKIKKNGPLPDWDETYNIMLVGLRERRPALFRLFCAQWPPSQTDEKVAVEQSSVALEDEIDSSVQAIANILVSFVNACVAVPDRPKGYLKQAIRSIGLKPWKLHEQPEWLVPEAVARIADHYVGRSKKFARQWLDYELGRGRLDLDRVKLAAQKALLDLKRKAKYDKRGGPVVQELPRLLAAALARVLGYWDISIGRRVHEDGKEEGNLKTLIEIIKPLIDATYTELTGHALSADPMVRYAIAKRKSVWRHSKLSYRGDSDADGNWPFSPDSVDAPVEGRGQAPHNLRPSNSLMSQKRDEISQRFTERRKAIKFK